MTEVHVVVPDGVDDPARPSGGNTYDREVCRGLSAIGWSVRQHAVAGGWPRPDTADLRTLAAVTAQVPDGAVLLVDGLIASAAPGVLVRESARLWLAVLVHMPLGHGREDGAGVRDRELAVLAAAAAVVTTSEWTRGLLLDQYGLPPARVHVAEPGVEPADLAAGTAAGGRLLCVAAVTPDKGHAVLLEALGSLTDLSWTCTCVGSLERDPAHAARVRGQARGLGDRVRFTGALSGADLHAAYAAADLLVLASRAETYGMVVTEALARGLPVVAADVGGVPDALGAAPDGSRPGLLVPPDDPGSLSAALRAWLVDDGLRGRLRTAARERRRSLSDWSATAARVGAVLARVAQDVA